VALDRVDRVGGGCRLGVAEASELDSGRIWHDRNEIRQ